MNRRRSSSSSSQDGGSFLSAGDRAFVTALGCELEDELSRCNRLASFGGDSNSASAASNTIDLARMRWKAHTSCLNQLIERFPAYGGLLTDIRNEYEKHVRKGERDIAAVVARMDRVRAQSGLDEALRQRTISLNALQAKHREKQTLLCRAKARYHWSVARRAVAVWTAERQAKAYHAAVLKRNADRRKLLVRLGPEQAADEEVLTAELSTQLACLEALQAEDDMYVPALQHLILRETLIVRERKIEALRAETRAAVILIKCLRLSIEALRMRPFASTTTATATATTTTSSAAAVSDAVQMDLTEDALRQRATRVLECSALFEKAFGAEEYVEAASIAVHSVEALLRTAATLERFRLAGKKQQKQQQQMQHPQPPASPAGPFRAAKRFSMQWTAPQRTMATLPPSSSSSPPSLVLSPLMTYCNVLAKATPTAAESLACVKCALDERRFDIVSYWLAQNFLDLTKEMGQALEAKCSCTSNCACTARSLALFVYERLGLQWQALRCHVQQGKAHETTLHKGNGAAFTRVVNALQNQKYTGNDWVKPTALRITQCVVDEALFDLATEEQQQQQHDEDQQQLSHHQHGRHHQHDHGHGEGGIQRLVPVVEAVMKEETLTDTMQHEAMKRRLEGKVIHS